MSFLIGASFFALVATTLGAVQVPSIPRAFPWSEGTMLHVALKGLPTPQQSMMVTEGTAFEVPSGRLFIPKVYGPGAALDGVTYLRVNGQVVAQNFGYSFQGTPEGLVYREGTSLEAVEVTSPAQTAQLWGYLVDVDG